jgi:hypothetical protein
MPSEPRQSAPVWIAVVLGLVTALVYSPVLATGFNADDFLILWRIRELEATGDPFGYFRFAFYEYFRPLGFLSFALDWRIWGQEPFGFHLTSLALHVANSLLVLHLAGRLLPMLGAAAAAFLFALHPASHEAVYWAAARFDLLAAFFSLLSITWLTRAAGPNQLLGGLAFALALLSKESAIALVLIVPAWDVFVARLPWTRVARRLTPLIAIALAYAAMRVVGGDLAAAGGERRLPKLVMMAASLVLLLVAAWRRNRGSRVAAGSLPATALSGLPAVAIAAAGVLAVLVFVPQTAGWAAEKIGFLTHVLFYGLSPIIFQAPPVEWFAPSTLPQILAALGFAIAGLMAFVLLARKCFDDVDLAVFLAAFTVAALLPVSSLTGGLRYLYLPGVAIALMLGTALSRLSRRWPTAAGLALSVALAVSTQQLLQAGRTWRAASDMTDEGLTLMAASVGGCDDDDILLLTAPVGIGGVYANFFWEALALRAPCPPRSLVSLLRVERWDVVVEVSQPSPDAIVMRVPDYRGNIAAASDLRNFRIPVLPGQQLSIDTPLGRLDSGPDGSAQVFRWTMNATAQAAHRYYYSAGRIRQ